MASATSKTGSRGAAGHRKQSAAKLPPTEALVVDTGTKPPNGGGDPRIELSNKAAQALALAPDQARHLLERYAEALLESGQTGRAVSFRVDINPAGETTVAPVEHTVPSRAHDPKEPSSVTAELNNALAAARERGQLRAAEILGGRDMLSAQEFAKLVGTTRVTVNARRQSGQLLGLGGAKRGFRFPVWQLDTNGVPFRELTALHEKLGGAWAVYRFLIQPHGELGGLTGRQALERGRTTAVLAAAESICRDFR